MNDRERATVMYAIMIQTVWATRPKRIREMPLVEQYTWLSETLTKLRSGDV